MVVSLVGACSGDAAPAPEAGSPTTVENVAPVLSLERAWRVAAEPLLTIGAGDARAAAGDTLYEFNDINGAKLLADGRIVVAVMGSHALRFFDGDGRFVGSAGRKGEGPGEFRQIMNLFRMRGDTLAVNDNLSELDWFTGEGKLIVTGRARRSDRVQVQTVAMLEDGTYFGVEFSHLEPEGRHRRRMLRLLRVDSRTGAVDSAATVPGVMHPAPGPGMGNHTLAFYPKAYFTARGDSLVTANSSEYELQVRSADGQIRHTVRRAWDPPSVTAELKESWKKWYLNQNNEQGSAFSEAWRRQQQPYLASDPFPGHLPAFLAIVASREGDLWVQRYDVQSVWRQTRSVGTQSLDAPAQWDVFDRAGRWHTTVELPSRFTLLDVVGDRLLGLVQNEDEEQGVQILRLVTP